MIERSDGDAAHWLLGDRAAAAAEAILDAAGRCFAARGVARTSMTDIAAESGCSRPTVYRYFEDRDALRRAFVDREASRLGTIVAGGLDDIDDPDERLVSGVLAALAGVRSDPTLSAWFTDGNAGAAAEVAGDSAVVEGLLFPLMAGDGDDRRARARWVVRVVLSLLAAPGGDEADERELLERFVVPVVQPVQAAAGRRAALPRQRSRA